MADEGPPLPLSKPLTSQSIISPAQPDTVGGPVVLPA